MKNDHYKRIINEASFGYAFHKLVVDKAGDPVDYIFIDINPAFENLTGLKSSQVLNKSITDVIPQIGKENFNWIKTYGEIALNGGEVQFEQYSETLKRWFSVKAFSSDKLYFTAIFTDVTNERLFSEKSELFDDQDKSAKILEKFFTINLDLLCIADMEGYFIKTNSAWSDILGYSNEYLNGRRFLDLVHPDDLPSTLDALSILKRNENLINFVNRYRTSEGSYRYIEWRSHPHGKLIYAAARDITEHIKTEDFLKKSEAKLKELNATKDKFFSIIAHDIKGVFNGILGFTDLMLANKETDPEKINRYSHILNNIAKKGYLLLENLLDWARLQTDRIEFNPQTVNLAETVNGVIEMSNLGIIDKNIQVNNSINSGLKVLADHFMLDTILRNLVSNAIKFNNEGGLIDIETTQYPGEVQIVVSDNGTGIKQENIPLLFNIDCNISTAGTHKEEGTGLGLILCKEFVEKHGGRLWIESTEGKGTSVFFTLPDKKDQ